MCQFIGPSGAATGIIVRCQSELRIRKLETEGGKFRFDLRLQSSRQGLQNERGGNVPALHMETLILQRVGNIFTRGVLMGAPFP